MGKRKASDAAHGNQAVKDRVGQPEDIYASLDNKAALALLLGTLERDASGFVKGTETTGNVCIIHLVLQDNVHVDVMSASRGTLNKSAWSRKIKYIIASSQYGKVEPRPRIMAWQIANLRCYRLKAGDLLIDTRKGVRGVVVPRNRKRKIRRARHA